MSIMSSQYPEPTPLISRRAAAAPAPGIPATGIPATSIPATGIPATGIPATGIPATGIQRNSIQRTGDQRIGDVERSTVGEELSGPYAAGRLTDDELAHRVTAAMLAQTWADLRPLLGDLPSAATVRSPTATVPTPTGTPWSAMDVLALVALVGTVGIALLGALAVVLGGEPGYVVVAILTATTAGVGGMALTQVLHRGHRSVIDRATQRAGGVLPAQRRLSGPA